MILSPSTNPGFENSVKCKRDFAIPFSLHARVETVNKEMLHELAEAGCRHITYGVESGSERVRREIMKRWATNQRFRDVFRWTKDAGIMPTANYIIGTPGETIAEMQETMVLHRELQPVDFGYFVFYPYPDARSVPNMQREWLVARRLFDPSGQSPPINIKLAECHPGTDC